MKVTVNTTAGDALVSAPLGPYLVPLPFVGLATGMTIAPCIVFPAGGTVLAIGMGAVSFTASTTASQTSVSYPLELLEGLNEEPLQCRITTWLNATISSTTGEIPLGSVALNTTSDAVILDVDGFNSALACNIKASLLAFCEAPSGNKTGSLMVSLLVESTAEIRDFVEREKTMLRANIGAVSEAKSIVFLAGGSSLLHPISLGGTQLNAEADLAGLVVELPIAISATLEAKMYHPDQAYQPGYDIVYSIYFRIDYFVNQEFVADPYNNHSESQYYTGWGRGYWRPTSSRHVAGLQTLSDAVATWPNSFI